MNQKELKDLFDKKGKVLEVKTNLPLDFGSKDKVWYVLSGTVDIFFVEKDKYGNIISSRNYILSCKKDQLFYNLNASGKNSHITLIAIGVDAKLAELPSDVMGKLITEGSSSSGLINLYDQWIYTLIRFIGEETGPVIFNSLGKKKTISLKKDDIFYPIKGIRWIDNKKGIIIKGLDIDSFNIPFIPISRHLWGKAIENVNLKLSSTKELIGEKALHDILMNLHELILNVIESNFETLKEKNKEQIKMKAQSDKNIMSESLSSIYKSITDNIVTKEATSYSDPLLKACVLIGEKMNIKIKEPLRSIQNKINDPLDIILKTSKIRKRQVLLRGEWWTKENGHFLAFKKGTKQPIVLLQKNSQTYEYIDTTDNTRGIVNQSIAKGFDPIVYMFFASFNEQITSMKKLWSFIRPTIQNDIVFLMIAAISGSGLGLLVPILTGKIMDDVIPQADKNYLIEIFLILIIVTVISTLLALVNGIFVIRMELKSGFKIQAAIMDHLLRLPTSFFKKYSSGDLTNRTLSINMIQQMLTGTLISSAFTALFSVVYLALLFYYNKYLALIGLLFAIIATAYVIIIGKIQLKDIREMTSLGGEIQGNLYEYLNGISKIRVAGAEVKVFKNWSQTFTRLTNLTYKTGMLQNYLEIFNSAFPLMTSMVFFYIIYTITEKITEMGPMGPGLKPEELTGISVGVFLTFIIAFRKFLNQSLNFGLTAISAIQIVPIFERIKPILEEETESNIQKEEAGTLSGNIEMSHVNFKYDQNGPIILEDINFNIKAGEFVAFVGASGSGKSTIIRLLLGFEKPESGSIFFDKQDFSIFDVDAIRRQMGVVLQNGSLVADSIFKVIVGNSNLTLDDAWEAAKMCGLDQDIEKMPMKMYTMVSPGGGTFSGGQTQRMLIARAIIHRPKILLFDEATSALDNKTQKKVTDSLDKFQATKVVIAHRISTVKNADKIYVMDQGKIKESGNYESLMKLNGLFAKMAKRQTV